MVLDDATITALTAADTPLPKLDPTRLSLHFYTSGSTGTPKRITKSLAMLESEVTTVDKVLTSSCGAVYSTVPHYHVYGLMFKLLWPLSAQHPFDTATYGLWEELLPQLSPQALIVSSPAHLRRLAGIAQVALAKVPAQILSAGSPLSFATIQEISYILGRTPTEIFGSTETGAMASRYPEKDNQPWLMLPGITIQTTEDGRLSLLSPHIGTEWYQTEDMVTLVPGGFHFLGRADSIVKVEGKRVSLIGVEQALCHLPLIEEAAVIKLPGEPDRLAAIAVLTDEGKSRLEELGNFRFSRLLHQSLERALERVAMPRLWRFVETMPTHSIGKRSLPALQALFEEA